MEIDLNTIAVNPMQPHQFAVGGDEEYAHLYDVRRLSDHVRGSLVSGGHPVRTCLLLQCMYRTIFTRSLNRE